MSWGGVEPRTQAPMCERCVASQIANLAKAYFNSAQSIRKMLQVSSTLVLRSLRLMKKCIGKVRYCDWHVGVA